MRYGDIEPNSLALTNLLTNSGFRVWSNSTLENVGSDLVTNGTEWTGATGATPPNSWSVLTAGTFTIDGASGSGAEPGLKLEVNGVPTAVPGIYQMITTKVGKLYRMSRWAKTISGSGRVYVGTGPGGTQYGLQIATDGGETETLVFEATTITTYITLYEVSAVAAEYSFFDTISCYEVTPSCIAADSLGPDGWGKTSLLDLHRVYDDSTHCKGLYGVKATAGSDAAESLEGLSGRSTLVEHLSLFRGRTITFCAWVYSVSVADNLRLVMQYDSASFEVSDFVAADTLTWVEITITVPIDSAAFKPYFDMSGSVSDVCYFSQPILIFASSIGKGNYSQPPGEVIPLETVINGYTHAVIDGGVNASATIEVDTEGKIGKGISPQIGNNSDRLRLPPSGADLTDGVLEGDLEVVDSQLKLSTADGAGNFETIGPCRSAFHATNAIMVNMAVSAHVVIVFDTARVNIGNDFDTGTYTFTAPQDGMYQLNVILNFNYLDVDADFVLLYIVTSNKSYYLSADPGVFASDPVYFSFGMPILVDLDEGDTAQVRLLFGGGAAQSNMDPVASTFSGHWVCDL